MLLQATWTVAEPSGLLVERLARELALPEVVARCLVNRDLTDPAGARRFLEPRLRDLALPDGMADLALAAERTARAVENAERIGVFGDYDVDGITSAALVSSFLRDIGCDSKVATADRFDGGYGLGPAAIDEMADAEVTLLIVLDCGTNDVEATARARDKGIDVIVIDHHGVEDRHPEVLAFVNPQRGDCAFEDRTLAAVGLAFYFVAAVRSRLGRTDNARRPEVDLKTYLDFVALGTIADVVPLVGNNRILVSHGLKQLSTARRPGLASLVKTSRIRSRKLRADHVSYQLAPRLNAAGRLASARDSLALLLARSQREADPLADRLETLTQERRLIEEGVSAQARRQIGELDLMRKPVLVVAGDGWHRGVLGIVAARMSEEHGKPAYVIGFDGGVGVGSARAQGQVDLRRSLLAVEDCLIRCGGHRDAAGFTVRRERLEELRERLCAHATVAGEDVVRAGIVCDGRLRPSQLNAALLKQLEDLGPFGAGNPEPLFEVGGLDVLDAKVVGGGHLKLDLKTPTGTVSAFGPRMGTHAQGLPSMIRVAAAMTANEWRGDGTVELRLAAPPVACDLSRSGQAE